MTCSSGPKTWNLPSAKASSIVSPGWIGGLALDLDGDALAAGEGHVDVGLAAELLGDLHLAVQDAFAGRRPAPGAPGARRR